MLKDSSLIARRLAPVRFVHCASRGYVKQYGAPRYADDLSNHRCLFYSMRLIPGEWRFLGPDGEVALRISGRFRANNGNMLYAAMLAGAGIGFVPTFVAGRNLAEGRLISLMPDYQPVESELSVIYPPGKNLSAIRSIAIEQVSHSRPFEVLELQAHSISRANTRMSFSSSFGILSFHTG